VKGKGYFYNRFGPRGIFRGWLWGLSPPGPGAFQTLTSAEPHPLGGKKI